MPNQPRCRDQAAALACCSGGGELGEPCLSPRGSLETGVHAEVVEPPVVPCRAGSSTPARASTVSAVRVLLTWLGVASTFSELVIPASRASSPDVSGSRVVCRTRQSEWQLRGRLALVPGERGCES